jgi:catecholate siderophore receptor
MILVSFAQLALPLSVFAAPADHFSVRGTVLDSTRAPIASARVTATPDGPGPGARTSTDQQGEFGLALEPGGYTVEVLAPGFRPGSQHVDAVSERAERLEFVLSVSPRQESVTVVLPDGYRVSSIDSATRTPTPLRDVPQSIAVTTRTQIEDQLMATIGDVVLYVPGVTAHQGENNRDQVIIRGNSSSADFFLNGVRDDVQYYRDLYNLERVEVLKGPNAMVFGRGGGGGVVNRVTKEAGFEPLRELVLQAGSHDNRRATADFDQPLTDKVALRLNAMYEESDSFREAVHLDRYGANPTLTVMPGPRTLLTFSYEHLHDARVADRGITSYQGRPADVDTATYYGDPARSHVRADVDLAYATIEHRAGPLTLRNHTLFGDYDRGYQNFVPGPVTPDKSQVVLSAYSNATRRRNVFSQTDLVLREATGRVRHTVLAGAEIGRQRSDNFRNTGFFSGSATSILVPYLEPTVSVPVTFRQSPTDADNHVLANVAAGYVQDQAELADWLQVIGGVRFDRFDLEYHDNRSREVLTRRDDLVSPRAGVVCKPIMPLSLYGSYGVSYLPSSGDQFSSLTTVRQQLEPEKFTSYEVGVKWDAQRDLSLTTALYRLDRTNTRSSDPSDATRVVQTGSQRTSGFEIGVTGRVTPSWSIVGGYAHQDAYVTGATTAARAGARVAQVPRHTLSLWNQWRPVPRFAVGVGVVFRSDMFAAIDDSVTLPGYTRVDGALYYNVNGSLRLQANVENLFDTRYYVNADNNTNISPGSGRALRLAVSAHF